MDACMLGPEACFDLDGVWCWMLASVAVPSGSGHRRLLFVISRFLCRSVWVPSGFRLGLWSGIGRVYWESRKYSGDKAGRGGWYGS